MNERVTISMDGGVADVRFNRPDKLNALDQAQIAAIADAIDRLGAMPGLRCVLLSGEGRGFCAGLDIAAVAGDPMLTDLMPRSHGVANLFQHLALGWRDLPVPVIAAIHGVAFGGGAQIALGADIRIAAPDAQIALMEMRWGLVPDMGAMPLLRGLVRDDVARELIYTGRRIGGEEAAMLGLVTRTADHPLAEARALAHGIAGNSPEAVRAAKRLLNRASQADDAALLLAESREQLALLASEGHRETLRAAQEKRAPQFTD
ncbi:crotonase/enoyl-CoA hydratase family protein [Sphingobium aquiterrae]|uniref:crotonase/enoyl-CoA hydratase family protein n=1 Tax=Sphingobium aquiterrae TaxID=2038656 RepID=UPI003017641E